MFYLLIKIWIRLTLKLFCRRITFSDPSLLQSEGPLLLACNHPNSFLDAIIVGSHFKRPVHFLARGDAFRKPFARKILSALKMIPIYRLSEGREYLALNDATFEQCRQILSAGGIVLIFAEGLCVHQWALRPLKKGAARIALDSWGNPAIADQFRVYPVSINYNSFQSFGKRVIIHFGETISKKELAADLTAGEAIHSFNHLLAERLKAGILQSNGDEQLAQLLISNYSAIDSKYLIADLKTKKSYAAHASLQDEWIKCRPPYLTALRGISIFINFLLTVVLAIPALAGWIMHIPLYYPIKKFVKEKTKGTVFYDSVKFGSLLLTYPLYWLVVNGIAMLVFSNNDIKYLFVLMPLFAWVCLCWKYCLQRVINYYALPAKTKKLIAVLLS